MHDYLDFIPGSAAGTLFAISVGVTAVTLRRLPDLRTKRYSRAMLSLQLAWSRSRASRLLASWREEDLLGRARKALRADLAFIVAYTFTLMLLTSLAARAASASMLVNHSAAGILAAVGEIAALSVAALDCVENLGLYRILD
jgi:hypothetical protein